MRTLWVGAFVGSLLLGCGGGGGGGGGPEDVRPETPSDTGGTPTTPTAPERELAVKITAPSTPLIYTEIQLEAEVEGDADENSLAYSWSVKNQPEVSTITLRSEKSKATVFLDALGDYEFALSVQSTSGEVTEDAVVVSSVLGPVYNAEELKAELEAKDLRTVEDVVGPVERLDGFAETRRLSTFHIDYLLGKPAGYTWNYLIDRPELYMPAGGAVLEAAEYKTTVEDAILVDNNVASIAYPMDYEEQTPADHEIADPFCDPLPEKIAIPASYLGQFSLPPIRPQYLGQDKRRIVRLKDVWGRPSPNYRAGCLGDVRAAFLNTLDRIESINANHVAVTPWTWFDGTTDDWRVMNPKEANAVSMHDEELTWVVQEAHRRGLKVVWVSQIQGVNLGTDDDGFEKIFFGEPEDPDQIRKTMAALDEYYAERGEFLESIGVDVAQIDVFYWTNMNSGVIPEDEYIELLRNNVANLKKNFTGEVAGPVHISKPGVQKELFDFVTVSLFQNRFQSEADMEAFSLSTLKAALSEALDQQQLENLDLPEIVFETGVQSRFDILYRNSYMEETFCTSLDTFKGISPEGGAFSYECIQKDAKTDFSVQAIFAEAALEVFAERNLENAAGIFVGYWLDDIVLGADTFPNIATGARSKPAEKIYYEWLKGYD